MQARLADVDAEPRIDRHQHVLVEVCRIIVGRRDIAMARHVDRPRPRAGEGFPRHGREGLHDPRVGDAPARRDVAGEEAAELCRPVAIPHHQQSSMCAAARKPRCSSPMITLSCHCLSTRTSSRSRPFLDETAPAITRDRSRIRGQHPHLHPVKARLKGEAEHQADGFHAKAAAETAGSSMPSTSTPRIRRQRPRRHQSAGSAIGSRPGSPSPRNTVTKRSRAVTSGSLTVLASDPSAPQSRISTKRLSTPRQGISQVKVSR